MAAWQEVHRLAAVLKKELGAREVRVFGSLALHQKGLKRFRPDADLDLAARGIPPERFFSAHGRLLMISPYSVDLIDMDACPPELRAAVFEEGIPVDP